MPAIHLHHYRVTADPQHGTLLLARENFEIRKAQARVTYTAGGQACELSLIGEARPFDDERGSGLQMTVADKNIRARTIISGKPGDASLEIVCELSLVDPAQPVRIAEFILLSADIKNTFLAPDAPEEILFRGEAPDAWTNAGNKRLNQPGEHLEFRAETSYLSGGYFHRRSGKGIFAYHVLPNQWIGSLRNENGCLTAAQKVDVPLRNLDVLRSDRLLLNFSEPLNDALASMAAHQKCRRRADEVAQHIAWNSWDYYKENISHDSIMADVHAIKSIPWMRDRVKYIIIDGFWEELVGDWEPNRTKFPKGMEGIAAEIRREGYVPGIWIGPYMADRNCKLLRDHPEYAVQYDGKPYSWYGLIGCDPPWGDRCYLDPTHPVVQEFLYEQLRKLRQWGYGYFKTDFLVDTFRPLLDVSERGYDKIDKTKFTFHDPDIGIARAHRNCMNTIRAAIGEESFWLGCGSFIPSGAEIMDGSRICSDIGPFWPSVRWNSQSAIFSSHLHGNAFLIDPDFAVFRGAETMDVKQLDMPVQGRKPYDPLDCNSGPPLSEAEARQWAAATILCGGLVTLSDKIAAMNERGLAIIRTLLDYCGGNAARPIDFAERVPALWLKNDRERFMLGVFNWDHDAPRTFKLKTGPGLPLPKRGKALEIWSGKEISLAGDVKLELAPRTVQLFVWNK